MDFGCLPEAIWVEIMSYLSLADRRRLSRTCRKLYQVFSYPGVWRNCCIIINMPTKISQNHMISDFEIHSHLRLDQSRRLIEAFGPFIKNLNLQLHGESFLMKDEEEALLKSLIIKCKKLKELSVDIRPNKLNASDLNNVLKCLSLIWSLIRNCKHSIQVLDIDSYVTMEDQALPLDCIPESLEKLSICHQVLTANKWIPMNMVTPTFTQVISIIQHQEALNVLSLHCQSVSSELLNELSRSSAYGQLLYPNLALLEILLVSKECPFYSISRETWKHFSSRIPKVLINISIGNTINPDWMSFLSHVSLHSLKFAQYSRYYPSLLSSFDPSELRSFIDFSQGCSEISELSSFISSCPKLERLVYNGNITVSTVLKLASLKGKRWREFKVNLDNVLIEYPSFEGIDVNDETIIAKSPLTGAAIQADLFLHPEKGFYLTEDNESLRIAELERMEKEVKKCISCHWEPLRKFKP